MYKLIILISKVIHHVIRVLDLGSGYAWSGYIALKLKPDILIDISKTLPQNIILISGTNGKTTTAKIVSHVLQMKGYKVLHNKTGGNLINGIVAAVLIESKLSGRVECDFAVFEIDELALPLFLKYINPKVIALLNLSRDQLDRYWEIDLLVEKWRKSISLLKKDTKLFLYKNQEEFQDLVDSFDLRPVLFDDDKTYLEKTNLIGAHNAINLNCAVLILKEFKIDSKEILKFLSNFDYAYGRGEEIIYKDKKFKIFLAKNPVSFNNNISMLLDYRIYYDSVLFILNDNIPDGRDVSWIYDIDPVPLAEITRNKKIFISGSRVKDMSVRLSYAGVKNMMLFDDIKSSIKYICTDNACKEIAVFPNYSSMLQLRKIIKGRSIL